MKCVQRRDGAAAGARVWTHLPPSRTPPDRMHVRTAVVCWKRPWICEAFQPTGSDCDRLECISGLVVCSVRRLANASGHQAICCRREGGRWASLDGCVRAERSISVRKNATVPGPKSSCTTGATASIGCRRSHACATQQCKRGPPACFNTWCVGHALAGAVGRAGWSGVA